VLFERVGIEQRIVHKEQGNFMWQLVGMSVIALVVLANSRDSDSRSERYHQSMVRARTDAANRRLQQHLQENRSWVLFNEQVALHYQSHLQGALAREQIRLQVLRLSEDRQLLKMLTEAVGEHFARKKHTSEHEGRCLIQQQIEQLLIVKRQTRARVDQAVDDLSDMKNQLRNFDANTRRLKLFIRDQCGVSGAHWYQRLESRVSERRLRTS
jgi:hypothetical protein